MKKFLQVYAKCQLNIGCGTLKSLLPRKCEISQSNDQPAKKIKYKYDKRENS